MATEKTLKARLLMKTDTSANWAKATNFIPKAGEIIIYSDDERKIKVGDGTTKVSALKFVNQDELAKIATLGDELTALAGTVDNISVGGRNLYIGTCNFDGDTWWMNLNQWTADGKYNGCLVYKLADQWNGLGQLISLEANTQYTLSAWMKQTDGGTVKYYDSKVRGAVSSDKGSGSVVEVGTNWSRCHVTFTVSTAETYLPRFEQSVADQSIWVAGLKLEKGNKATDWSPAPEDLVPTTRTINSKPLSSNITLTASDVGALPTTGGTITGTLSVNGDLISKQVLYCMSNNVPQLTFRNADNSKVLMTLNSNSTTGDYADVYLTVHAADSAASFTFGKTGDLTVPGGVYSKGQYYCTTNSYPGLMIRGADNTMLAQLYNDTAAGGRSNFVISVAQDSNTWKYYIFGKDGNLTVPGAVNATSFNGNASTATELSGASPRLAVANDGNDVSLISNSYVFPELGTSVSRITKALDFRHYDTHWRIGNLRGGGTESVGFGFSYSADNETFTLPMYIKTDGSIVSKGLANTFGNTSSAGDAYLAVQNANGKISLDVSSNRGIWDYTKSRWMIYNVKDGDEVLIPAWASKGSSSTPIYLNEYGYPVAMSSALPISLGGTGSTTATGACSNIGALPKSGGTITGSLIVNNIMTSNYFQTDSEFVNLGESQNGEYGIINLGNMNYGDWISLSCSANGNLILDDKVVYADGNGVIYSSSTPSTTVKGTIWLKPV